MVAIKQVHFDTQTTLDLSAFEIDYKPTDIQIRQYDAVIGLYTDTYYVKQQVTQSGSFYVMTSQIDESV